MPHLSDWTFVYLTVFFILLLAELWPLVLLQPGKRLERAGRHSDAFAAYEKAIRRIPPFYKRMRAITMMKLSLSAYHAGHYEQSYDWAQRTIALHPQLLIYMLAYRQAANALSTMNRLDEAEPYLRTAWEVANHANKRDEADRALLQLSELQRKRGHIDDAMRLTQQAIVSRVKDQKLALACLCTCLADLGRFEEARDTLLQIRKQPPFPSPHRERYSQGTYAYFLAAVEAKMGRAEEASAYLQEAQDLVGRDEKLGVWCESLSALVLALQGRTEQAIAQVEKMALLAADYEKKATGDSQSWPPPPRSADYNALNRLRGLYEMLGRATLELRNYHQSERYWNRYLEINPSPLVLTTIYYHLGECRRQLGDNAGAKEAYRKSVELNIPSYHAKLATERLEELGVTD